MIPLHIEEVITYTQSGTVKNGEDLLSQLQKHMIGEVCLYAVMDHAVVLGLYNGGKIEIGLKAGRETKILTELPFPYLQELRVFNQQQEFRAVKLEGNYIWRLRVDGEEGPGFRRLNTLDEVHKLWGAVRKEEDSSDKWSLLSAKRGSGILFPEHIPCHGEKGVCVRNYLYFGKADEENGLVQYVDERLLGFMNWPVRKEGKQGNE